MKKFLIAACLIFCVSNIQAEDCKPRKVTEYKCRNICDYAKGFGYYLKDTTCQVGDGIGMIFSAPFKAKFCLPEPRQYRYYHGKLKYCPPKLERVNPKEPTKPKIQRSNYQFPIYREPEPFYSEYVNLIEFKF